MNRVNVVTAYWQLQFKKIGKALEKLVKILLEFSFHHGKLKPAFLALINMKCEAMSCRCCSSHSVASIWCDCLLQVEVLYGDEPLKDYYTLMDIAYFYEWRRVSGIFEFS